MNEIGTAFQVAEQPFAAIQGEIVAAFNATRARPAENRRFDWMYRDNPDGEAIVWTARNGETGELAGFTACLPRRMCVRGVQRNAWIGADFSVLPKYRTLGIAVKLRRAAKDAIDAGRADFLYAHPNDKMALIHARVGHRPVAAMERWARVIRSGTYLAKKLPNLMPSRAIGAGVDRLIRARDGLRRPRGVAVRLVERPAFDERFGELSISAGRHYAIYGIRDARYLAWRYGECPAYDTHALLAEDDSRLRGYALFGLCDGALQVRDLFAPGDERAARALIAGLIDRAWDVGAQSVSAVVLESHPLRGLFSEFSFRIREDTSQMFGYAPDAAPWRRDLFDPTAWFLTVGDRDV